MWSRTSGGHGTIYIHSFFDSPKGEILHCNKHESKDSGGFCL